MPTTLVSRKNIRQSLVTVMSATNSWNAVYGYVASAELIDGKAPVLFITSVDSSQTFAASAMNPSTYSFLFESYVRMQAGTSWTAQNAEDKLDDLDLVVRQTIRNNIGVLSSANSFDMPSPSETGYAVVKGKDYRIEQWIVVAKMYSGGV